MSTIPAALQYSEDHEWVSVDGDIATIGITDHAQDQLGDVVYLGDFSDPGEDVDKGDVVAVVESSKASSDIFSPISGEVIEVNDELADEPDALNSDPYASWIVKIRMADQSELAQLMNHEDYQAFVDA
jgi:glycine cleavage system H protein